MKHEEDGGLGMVPGDLRDRLALARLAARAGGAAALERFGSGRFRVESKVDRTPVTEADREAETRIRGMIRDAFPEDGIVGEEHGAESGRSGYRWIIDPIDGTQSFIRGVPLWGTLIAMEVVDDAGRAAPPCLGVIHMPALGETVYAGSGLGAWHESAGRAEASRAAVSGVREAGDGLAVITGYSYFRDAGCSALYGSLLDGFGHSRGWSDCYAHLLIATGRADACIEPTVAVWDIAASYPIIREAGGLCTSWDGTLDARSNNALVTNGHLHESLLAQVRGWRSGDR